LGIDDISYPASGTSVVKTLQWIRKLWATPSSNCAAYFVVAEWSQSLGGAMTSFQADIRPLFTERDIQGMSEAFNLGSCGDVKIAR
jgi:hypothetical protein